MIEIYGDLEASKDTLNIEIFMKSDKESCKVMEIDTVTLELFKYYYWDLYCSIDDRYKN
jgi:hypothetical protein